MNVIEILSNAGQTTIEFDQNVDENVTVEDLMEFAPVTSDMIIEEVDGNIVTLSL